MIESSRIEIEIETDGHVYSGDILDYVQDAVERFNGSLKGRIFVSSISVAGDSVYNDTEEEEFEYLKRKGELE